jgi:hypothetical protein
MGEEYSEFGETVEDGAYHGVSRGPGADLGRAIQQAARAAADDGRAGDTFDLSIQIEPQEHNQWVKQYSVIIRH